MWEKKGHKKQNARAAQYLAKNDSLSYYMKEESEKGRAWNNGSSE